MKNIIDLNLTNAVTTVALLSISDRVSIIVSEKSYAYKSLLFYWNLQHRLGR